jgi:hypothetical protein
MALGYIYELDFPKNYVSEAMRCLSPRKVQVTECKTSLVFLFSFFIPYSSHTGRLVIAPSRGTLVEEHFNLIASPFSS